MHAFALIQVPTNPPISSYIFLMDLLSGVQIMVSLLDTIRGKNLCKLHKLCMNTGPGGSSISLISAIIL